LRLTHLLQKAKELLSVSANANYDAVKRDTMGKAKGLAESIQAWKKCYQTLSEKFGMAEKVRIRSETMAPTTSPR
jgi:hypothetical protein